MKTPESLETLVEYGIIQKVVRPLMSGKEAQVYVVISGGEECVAKVYKEANQRTFKHRVEYTEGRRTRNTRDQRAIKKRTRHGRKQDEAAWRTAEVDTLYRVRDGGVRVPEPINFVEGVLVMELVRDATGEAAPRLGDLEFSPQDAYEIYQKLIREVVRMLCAGAIHGDLSEFNVLMGADGPVVIDFPQSVDPAKNQSARKLLLRDVENLHRFLAKHAPDRTLHPLGEEMWALYEKNLLAPETELNGDYQAPVGNTNMDEVLALIEDANQDELMRRDARGDDTPLVAPAPPLRRVVDFTAEASAKGKAKPKRGRSPSKANPKENPKEKSGTPRSGSPQPPLGPSSGRVSETGKAEPSRRRSRGRRPARTGATDDSRKPAEEKKPAPSAENAKRQATRSANSGDENRAPKRRRRRKTTTRASADETKAAPPGGSRRPPSGPASSRDEDKPPPKGAGADPRPRRRRRPRTPDSTST
jgi:RIO kinase 1